ncbi:MAG: YceI family protein [Actinomycetota bacterium]|nr:YceI family protein [Actinomycetota bacterium]
MTVPTIPTGTWVLDPGHTEVGFTVRHIMSKVRGSFTEFEGTIVTGETLADSSAHVQVALSSIDTRNQQRDDHLRSSDFFDVATNPTMTFRSTSVQDTGGGRLVLTGDLTIKGVTRPVDLDVEVLGVGRDPWGATRIGVEASGQISRREFGVDFNIPLEGDKVMIGDKITLAITAQAVLQQAAAEVPAGARA